MNLGHPRRQECGIVISEKPTYHQQSIWRVMGDLSRGSRV